MGCLSFGICREDVVGRGIMCGMAVGSLDSFDRIILR